VLKNIILKYYIDPGIYDNKIAAVSNNLMIV